MNTNKEVNILFHQGKSERNHRCGFCTKNCLPCTNNRNIMLAKNQNLFLGKTTLWANNNSQFFQGPILDITS